MVGADAVPKKLGSGVKNITFLGVKDSSYNIGSEHTFNEAFDGWLFIMGGSHYPASANISFSNTAATSELIHADSPLFTATESWGGYIIRGCACYKIKCPANTTMTISLGTITQGIFYALIN